LNEITESDLILHIADISHPNFDDHIDSVNQILEQIKCAEKPSLLVYNKVDKLNEEELENFKFKENGEINLFISAQNKINIDELKIKLYSEVRKIHIQRFPYNNFLYPDLN
jgi:GTP-binding protein HflX